MPDKPLTVATYAAGASLAAIALIYVFSPTYIIDNSPASSSKKGVVGLTNSANDCFINSVLQVLAGLTDLRVYLIRETHRRNIDEPSVYLELVHAASAASSSKPTPDWKLEGLQQGIVTQGLKEILDQLNERPIYKKTISAFNFVQVLQTAFRQRISRQQQDAQEFLQIVAERLCDEYHAGSNARRAARRRRAPASSSVNGEAIEERLAGLALDGAQSGNGVNITNGADDTDSKISSSHTAVNGTSGDGDGTVLNGEMNREGESDDEEEEDEVGFPMEGRLESQIECQKCGFKPRPTETTFCTLTLSVPQVSSVGLNTCIDGFFKTEYVDDYKCEKCRLIHALEQLEYEMARSSSNSFKDDARESMVKIKAAIDNDPEKTPDVVLPDMRYAPKCRIARHTRITNFPKILSIHLSRSIYDISRASQKNSAKVAFPERLPMGGLLNQKKYKLLGTVMHKGSHNSGHYESFRRQNIPQPFATANAFQPSNAFTPSVAPSPVMSPQVRTAQQSTAPSPLASTPDLVSRESSGHNSRSSPTTGSVSASSDAARESTDSASRPFPPTLSTNGHSSPFSPQSRSSFPKGDRDSDSVSLRSVAASAKSTVSRLSNSVRNSRSASPAPSGAETPRARDQPTSMPSAKQLQKASKEHAAAAKATAKRSKKQQERWWRISDDKIKEAKTSDVLAMQREVYLLFYELDREDIHHLPGGMVMAPPGLFPVLSANGEPRPSMS